MSGPGLPLVEELPREPDVEEAFLRLAGHPHCLFLDSAQRDPVLGRYSFLAAEPFAYLEQPVDCTDSLAELAATLARFKAEPVAGLPPFQGGAAGLLSYDLGRQLETVAPPAFDEFCIPALAMGLYDVVLAIDHVQRRAWIVSQGFPETEPARRVRRAAWRLAEFRKWLGNAPSAAGRDPKGGGETAPDRVATRGRRAGEWLPIPACRLAPQYAARGPKGLTSNFSESAYLDAVRRAIDYIWAGDVFQVNLSQRLLFPAREDPTTLYLRLRQRNPAPFAGYFDLGPATVVSASPERFLRVFQGQVEARPIKGTRPRTARPEADLFAAADLRQSEKDRAENVMIVDLLRNDLSRVCLADSVQVSQLCRVECYAYVQHLVSAVCGRLRSDFGPLDLVRAAFPGGSVTGAPKVRAMEIIAELEPTARGPYCGSLGYVGFDRTMDLSILIRTITVAGGWWQAPVGGGIVAQSDPRAEYEETWHKAEGLLRAMIP